MNSIPKKKSVGIDVAKKNLAVFILSENKHFKVANNAMGHEKLLKKIGKYDVDIVVMEATAGYELGVLLFLQRRNFNVWRVEPRRTSAYRKSEGIRAKTDASDAKMLAMFGAEKNQRYKQKPITDEEIKLQSLSRRKDVLTEMLKGEKTRYQQEYELLVKKMIKDSLDLLQKQIKHLEQEIKKLIDLDKELKRKAELAQTMKGVGFGLAVKLIVDLSELGNATGREVSALAGVAPYSNESGSFKGHSFIRGGRGNLRKVLYMAALSAAFHNPVLKKFYEKLIKAGKKPKVALIAVARKMLVKLNAMFMKNEAWKEA